MMPDLTPEPWMSDASCATVGIGPDLWFPGLGDSTNAAKAICSTCPTTRECRDYSDKVEASGFTYGLLHGVWAGESPRERQQRRRREVAA